MFAKLMLSILEIIGEMSLIIFNKGKSELVVLFCLSLISLMRNITSGFSFDFPDLFWNFSILCKRLKIQLCPC